MKSQHESHDDELRERLLHYTEEPERDLWGGIAPHIVSVNPEPVWVVWTQRVSAVVIGGVAIMIASFQIGIPDIESESSAIVQEVQSEGGVVEKASTFSLKRIEKSSIDESQSESRVIAFQESQPDVRTNSSLSEKSMVPASNLDLLTSGQKEMIMEAVMIEKPRDEGAYLTSALSDTSKIAPVKTNVQDTLKKEAGESKANDKKNQRHRNYTI